MRLPDWRTLLRTARPVTGRATLDSRHVYILPSRQGLLFGTVLLGMLIGAINYSLSLGFVLTFLLGGLGIVAMLHTWRNLAGITLDAGRCPPVFAGEEARFTVVLSDPAGRDRYAIALRLGEATTPVYADIAAGQSTTCALRKPAPRRGWLELGRITVDTGFPLGLFRAWSYVELGSRCLVYPAPATTSLPLPSSANPGSGTAIRCEGDDDFSGLRPYQPGDSPKRIDWKASAREQGLLAKQFQGMAGQTVWLDWYGLPGQDTEAKIRQLARWVVDAEQAGLRYGLRLPGREIAPGAGESQRHLCLEALALL